ncbi:MAG: undecaprenyldiphospho-muramoylpentapeptide beta-N-acetylglucosaminyltransferase [Ruminococcus sp.]|nr:undecaprenyldiphospho-muramoylpentapeptide beta-N-acetylglucosaminyltransferase [Ruminococcus sp.]
MRVLLAGGGTAGHINPAIAIAQSIRQHCADAQILFVGNEGGLEQRLVPGAGFDIKTVSIRGFQRSLRPRAIVRNVGTVFKAVSASSAAKKIIREFSPDICVGTGGYVSGPVIQAAQKLGIPTVIHEQNAYPGVTTKMLSKKAKRVMLAMDAARSRMDSGCNFVLTGNPVRPQIILADKEKARQTLGLDSRPMVLSFGGSMGARKINESVASVIARSGKDGRYQHIHAYGQYGKWFPDLLREKGADPDKCSNLDIREYIDNMDVCLAAADVVVCRCGAITLSEIQIMGKPSVLIPSPNVAENHQYHNAMALVERKAASVIEEKDLTDEKLTAEIDRLLSDEALLAEYAAGAKSMAIDDANERIFAVITEVLAEEKK